MPTPERHGKARDTGHERRRRQRPCQRLDAARRRHEQFLAVVVTHDAVDDLLVGQLTVLDALTDELANLHGRGVARLVHALALAHGAGQPLLERDDTLVGRLRPVVTRDADRKQPDDDEQQRQPARPTLDTGVPTRAHCDGPLSCLISAPSPSAVTWLMMRARTTPDGST